MFKLKPNPTFKSVVTIPTPGVPSGTRLPLVFRHKTKKEFLEFYTTLTGDAVKSDVDVVFELVAGWEDVEVEYNKQNLEELLDNYPAAALAIMDAYRVELLEARVKN
jgi:hypothetical protein